MSSAIDRRTEALRRLPVTHSLALRLRDAGLTDDLVAQRLGIETEAIGPLIVIAQAKFAALLDGDQLAD